MGSLFGTVAFMTAFNPSSDYTFIPNFRFAHSIAGLKIDSQGYSPKHGPYYMGADDLAASIVYFALFYNKMWVPGMGLMALHTLYHGPKSMGGPFAALLGA